MTDNNKHNPDKRTEAEILRQKKRLASYTAATGNDYPLRWLAARSGGIYVVDRDFPLEGLGFRKIWYDTWCKLHDLRSEIRVSFEDDGEFDEDELVAITYHWLKYVGWGEGLLLALEKKVGIGPQKSDNPYSKTILLEWLQSYLVMMYARDHQIHEDDGVRLSIAKIAEAIDGVGASTVGNWCKHPDLYSGSANPLKRVEESGRRSILEALYSDFGGRFIRGTTPIFDVKDSINTWTQTHLAMARFDAAVVEMSNKSDRFREEDIAEFRVLWESVKAHANGFIEQMGKKASANRLGIS